MGLLDQSGKGFETTPRTYGKLEEEELRNVLLGHLNAVFLADEATGETFSKRGKTDIFLRVSGGAVQVLGRGEALWCDSRATVSLRDVEAYRRCRHDVRP